MRMLNLGILAHVDAGKTSLTERLLFEGGAIARMGAVDEGNTQTDAMDLERRRGTTIRSAVATFTSGDHEIHLIDTPGHADFIAEVERALGVLDGAIPVLSAVEGVQAQTRLLMRTLREMGLPTLLFVNKIDRPGARYESLLDDVRRWLSPSAISMRDPQSITEILAENNDSVLKSYLYEPETLDAETLHDELAAQTRAALVHPVFFGSAVTGAGIDALLQGITNFLPSAQGHDTAPLDGTVFAIERGPGGGKQAVARIFCGSVTARDTVTYRLDRLGHVVRTREHADRRVVTLRSSSRIEVPAREFFGPFSGNLEALVAQYPPEQVEQFENFLRDLRTSMNDLLAEQA
jgi:ribosomal protection tetracycline resistance protein